MTDAIGTLNNTTLAGGPSQSDTSDVVLAVGIESMNAYEGKVNQYYKMVHRQNVLMANLNKCMEFAQSKQGIDHGVRVDTGIHLTNPDTDEPEYVVLSTYLQDQGVALPSKLDTARDRNWNKDQWKVALDNMKTASDSISSGNQVDMMKLQSVLNKSNQMSSMTSDIMSKANTAAMGIIGNMPR